MRHLRQRFPAIKISVEVEKPGRQGLQELAAEADVVFYSKSWAQVSSPWSACILESINMELCFYCREMATTHPKTAYELKLLRYLERAYLYPSCIWCRNRVDPIIQFIVMLFLGPRRCSSTGDIELDLRPQTCVYARESPSRRVRPPSHSCSETWRI
jgi:hypothetical protein